jgi:diguanylate cyclase (GGDEF)-like protein
LLSIFSKKISLALANAIHYAEMITAQEAATIDYLTGLANRRFLIDIGNKLIANSKRTAMPIAVAMIDIDFFKKVNDNYGHDIGDEVLKKIAYFLKMHVRDSDCAARFGGEEFCIIATNISSNDVKLFFEGIREGVSRLSVKTDGVEIKVTVSIGVSLSIGHDIDEMIKAADEKLYQAKEEGRNRVVC